MKAEAISYKPPKLFGSVRLTLAILTCAFNFLNMYFLLSFSMSLLCMTEQDEFSHWDKKIVSLLTSAFSYGKMVGALIGGFVASKWGQKWPMSISVFIYSVAMGMIPLLAPVHWAAVLALRSIQGIVSGVTSVIVYNIFSIWSSADEKATLLAIAYAGVPLANIMSYPVTAALCLIPFQDGWPMTFYVPACLGLIWWLLHLFLTFNYPADHPRISNEELLHLQTHAVSVASEEKPKLPVKGILKSLPLYAMLIHHFSLSWCYYLIALNIPVYVEATFDVDVIVVSLNYYTIYVNMIKLDAIFRMGSFVHYPMLGHLLSHSLENF